MWLTLIGFLSMLAMPGVLAAAALTGTAGRGARPASLRTDGPSRS